jgi:hypothetical protein
LHQFEATSGLAETVGDGCTNLKQQAALFEAVGDGCTNLKQQAAMPEQPEAARSVAAPE